MATPQLNLAVRTPTVLIAIIDIHGEVTGAAEMPLMNAYDEASKHGTRTLILNFPNPEYMNNSAIGCFRARSRAQSRPTTTCSTRSADAVG